MVNGAEMNVLNSSKLLAVTGNWAQVKNNLIVKKNTPEKTKKHMCRNRVKKSEDSMDAGSKETASTY